MNKFQLIFFVGLAVVFYGYFFVNIGSGAFGLILAGGWLARDAYRRWQHG